MDLSWRDPASNSACPSTSESTHALSGLVVLPDSRERKAAGGFQGELPLTEIKKNGHNLVTGRRKSLCHNANMVFNPPPDSAIFERPRTPRGLVISSQQSHNGAHQPPAEGGSVGCHGSGSRLVMP